MTGRNMLVIMTDEQTRNAAGCYGHPIVSTPNIDKLAANGTRFTQAYTSSPICVPARASFATGTYVHQNKCWSNAQAYAGQVDGWGHRLLQAGHDCVSIGKLHYRSAGDPNGFSEEIDPLYIHNGLGFVHGLLRKQHLFFDGVEEFPEKIGPGDDPYTDYDRGVCEKAKTWLAKDAAKRKDKPWTLFVSFLRPHYPLTCPREFYGLYPLRHVPRRRYAGRESEYSHPVLAAMRHYQNYDDYFDDHQRQVARASYLGLCSFVDDLIGQVLVALEDSGQADNTDILFTSDHGEMLGDHGFWTKMVMYEEAVGIPMILSGPGVPKGTCTTPVTLVDVHKTILNGCGVGLSEEDRNRPGQSLYDLANGMDDEERVAFSEYHDCGAITGMFMIRYRNWKYIYYPGFPPQLFDMNSDPYENRDLAHTKGYKEVIATCHQKLLDICDPDAVNDQCFDEQAALIDRLGGVKGILDIEPYDYTPVE